MRKRPTHGRPGQGARRRGFTLTEVMIATAVTSLIMVAMASLQYISARSVKQVVGEAQMRGTRARAIDQVRFRLAQARIGSCEVSQSGRRIEFVDPSLGGSTSALFFNADSGTLFWDEDIADGAGAVDLVNGPLDITFEVQGAGAVINLEVRTSSDVGYGDVDLQDGIISIYLRNI